MGQFTLLAVFASFFIGGIVVFNADRSADNADEKVWEHQYHVVARDAASTGMASAIRALTNHFEANTPWNGGVASSMTQTDIDYDGGTYSITATATADAVGSSACPLLSAAEYEKAMIGTDGLRLVPQGDIIAVTATGSYEGDVGGDVEQSHQLRACYLQADYGLFSPPAYNYGYISGNDFTFNEGPTIQALVDGEGHVHSNGDMDLGPQVIVDGHATYQTGQTGTTKSGTQVSSIGPGPAVPLEPFDANAFAIANGVSGPSCGTTPEHCRYDTGFFGSGPSGGAAPPVTVDIQPPTTAADDREGDPYIWYIDGDFVLTGNVKIRVPQYTQIVVKGNISISGGASVTVTSQTATDMFGDSLTEAESKQWVLSQLFDGQHSPLAWFGTGTATMGGSPGIVGNFYVNGDVELNGGGKGNNTAGSFASANGSITANGEGNGNNFWFLEVADENVVDGIKLPGKQIVRLALAEWTDPVLDYVP